MRLDRIYSVSASTWRLFLADNNAGTGFSACQFVRQRKPSFSGDFQRINAIIFVIIYNIVFGLIEFNLYEILNVIFTYTGLIVVPLFFIVIYIEKVLLRKRTQEAGFMNTKIRESEMHQKPGVTRIRIVSDKSKDVFESDSTDLLLVEGQSNYTKFYFIANGSLKTTLLLMTLKQAESQLQDYKEFIRCHKSNIVNLTRVKSESAGYKLSVLPIEEPARFRKVFIKNLIG